jgi:PAS domain S-box-containing protein
MEDNIIIRFLTILLFILSGLAVGIIFSPLVQDINTKFLLGIGLIFIIAMSYAIFRWYLFKQKRIISVRDRREEMTEVGFVVDTFHDLVTRLKEKERELERLKALAEEKANRIEIYSENILQSVPSGVVSIDNSMEIKSINQAAQRILGVDAGDVLGGKFNEVFDEPLINLLKEGKTVSRAEYPYVTRDKRHIWLGITTSQLRNEAGKVIGQIFVFTDLTDIKALQAQVELKERLSQLGEMSAGISHELRNSISVISGYAKLLDKKVEESGRVAVKAILEEVENINKIISELLSFARPTVLNMGRIDLERLIKETIRSVVDGNELVRVLINMETSISINADEVLLRQALTNLFINALDAMPEGGSLEIGAVPFHDKVEITIRDTGHGIPEDIRQKIFLPFYTTKEKGIGLGLALVQKIIVSHGGSIEVESKEGEGTLFRIILPGGS